MVRVGRGGEMEVVEVRVGGSRVEVEEAEEREGDVPKNGTRNVENQKQEGRRRGKRRWRRKNGNDDNKSRNSNNTSKCLFV